MPLPKRRTVGFNLAFLDIMSCGLGAIILIFMMVKYHSERIENPQHILRTELSDISKENTDLAAQNRSLREQLEALRATFRERAGSAAQKDESAAQELIQLISEITQLEKKLAQQEQAAKAALSAAEEKRKTVQDHLIGLRVRGKRIVILLDTSASMAEERLVDIIKIKAADMATKQSAPKWRRALAVVRWIVERTPADGRYAVIGYNSAARFSHPGKWLYGGDAAAEKRLSQALEELYPHGATDLHAALEFIKTQQLSPTDIYLITDSLPTQGGGRISRTQRIRACGLQKKTTVSGICRLALFGAAVRSFTSSSSATVSTVLLPIEGDPEAAYAYWLWSARSGGVMISPTVSWP